MEEIKKLGSFLSGLKMSEKQAEIINDMLMQLNAIFMQYEERNNQLEGVINGIDDPRLYVNYFNRAINILIILGLDLYELRLNDVFLEDDFLTFVKLNKEKRKMTIDELVNMSRLFGLFKFDKNRPPESLIELRDYYKLIKT